MRYIKFLFIALVMLLASNGRVSANNKCEPEMYMFGFAFSFNDSTMYITTVQKVNDVWVTPRNGQIIERETYAHQLETYFENDGVMNMTCGLSFNTNKKKVLKRYAKIKERYTKKLKNMHIVYLSDADFSFKSFVPMQIDDDKQATVNEKKLKKSKKSKK